MTRNPVVVDGNERAGNVAKLMVEPNLKRVVVKTEKGYIVASARLLIRDALMVPRLGRQEDILYGKTRILGEA